MHCLNYTSSRQKYHLSGKSVADILGDGVEVGALVAYLQEIDIFNHCGIYIQNSTCRALPPPPCTVGTLSVPYRNLPYVFVYTISLAFYNCSPCISAILLFSLFVRLY